MSYCSYCATLESNNHHKIYHDNHYGFKIESDNELFGRLILEINQAGLSWNTILIKQDNFRKAFDNYDIEEISNYGEDKINSLLNDAGIVRNKLKVNAVVYNARKIQDLKIEHYSFKNWLDKNHPKSLDEWVKLFKKTFKFVGGEIVNEFLMSTGYLEGAHDEICEVYQKVKSFNVNR